MIAVPNEVCCSKCKWLLRLPTGQDARWVAHRAGLVATEGAPYPGRPGLVVALEFRCNQCWQPIEEEVVL
jgi:hypothetical protein